MQDYDKRSGEFFAHRVTYPKAASCSACLESSLGCLELALGVWNCLLGAHPFSPYLAALAAKHSPKNMNKENTKMLHIQSSASAASLDSVEGFRAMIKSAASAVSLVSKQVLKNDGSLGRLCL